MANLGLLKCHKEKYKDILTKLVSESIQIQSLSSFDNAGLQIKTVVQKLETYIVKYEDVYNKCCAEEKDLCSEAKEVADLIFESQEKLEELKALLEHTQSVNKDSQPSPPVFAGLENQLSALVKELHAKNTQSATPSAGNATVRLPQLDIPSFNGSVLKWQGFWDSFEAAVHNSQLSEVEKLHYLSSKLTGEAQECISGLPLTNGNYAIAIEALTARFGNTQTVVDAHYATLMALPAAKNDAVALRELSDKIEKHLRCLQSLKQDTKAAIFVSLIMSKLPGDVVIQLELLKESDSWSVEALRAALKKYVSAREASQHAKELQQQLQPEANRTARQVVTAEALVASERSRFNPSCHYCSQKHWSDECTVYSTLESRKRQLQDVCLICLKKGHEASVCKAARACYHCKAKSAHHRSLCPAIFGKQEAGVLAANEVVLMQTAKADITNPSSNHSVKAHVLLDTGSHRTYVSEDLAARLRLKRGKAEVIHLSTFGNNTPTEVVSYGTKLNIRLQDGSEMTVSASIVPRVTSTLHRASVNTDEIEDWSTHYASFSLADSVPQHTEHYEVDLLIGSDYYLDIVLTRRHKLSSGLYLLESKLGWILTGRLRSDEQVRHESSMVVIGRGSPSFAKVHPSLVSVEPCSYQDVQDLWSLEALGIRDDPYGADDDKVKSFFSQSIRFQEGRYQVSFPWKPSAKPLPSNYYLALGRLRSLSRKLLSNSTLATQYDQVIQQQHAAGIIEKIEPDKGKGTRTHYIPHHAVVTPSKATTKVRIVYDASAKTASQNPSLNECLHRGPVILEDLGGLLLRFRKHRVVLLADIEKAFLQVGLNQKDRDATRFLWLKDPTQPVTEHNIQAYRFCRVPFGIVCSPFLLAATVQHHLSQSTRTSPVAEQILSNLYVDNVITGVDDAAAAEPFYREAKQLFQSASMNLRDWASNEQEFIASLPVEDRASRPTMKVLGMVWDSIADNLQYSHDSYLSLPAVRSKRDVLHVISSVFDPLGLISPALVPAKVFLQQLWHAGHSWDSPLSPQELQEWNEIAVSLPDLRRISISRYVGLSSNATFTLAGFCDASAKAYCTAVYLIATAEGSSSASLIFAKTRLAPKKPTTIPRLELLAAVIGCRAIRYVTHELRLPITSSYLWSDSQCVLKWIGSPKQLSTFVENRVEEIRKHSLTFRYIHTSENPSDIGSRGTSATDLNESSLWWNGPEWLTHHPSKWPSWDVPELTPDNIAVIEKETKGSPIMFEAGLNVVGAAQFSSRPFGLDREDFSSLRRLVRFTALCLRFIAKLKKQCPVKGNPPLLTEEIGQASLLWERHVQEKNFPEEMAALRKGKATNLCRQLGLKLDGDGVIRCHGRLHNAELPYDTKFPKLLPSKDHLTSLIIKDRHEKALHVGVSHTLAAVRQTFWVLRGRATVKRILNGCLTCKRYEGGPFPMPAMPPLPTSRVTRSTPFSHTGVDYFGPLYASEAGSSTSSKVWVCLFTCLVTRAVHLEVVLDMSAEQFLLGIRRFIATRAKPTSMISDNAPQMKLVDRTLSQAWKDVMEDPSVQSYVSEHSIQWRFIPEFSPWMGGFYERLVGLVKRCLRKSLGKVVLTTIQLQTLMKEVEAVVNTRPLLYVDSDVNNPTTLCPAHLLSSHIKLGVPEMSEGDNFLPTDAASSEKLLEAWKKGQHYLNQFWQLFEDEYLTSLREKQQQQLRQTKVKSSEPPVVGNTVLIKGTHSRGTWKMGRIVQLTQSHDNQTRSAKVATANSKVIVRPLCHLYPLESVSNTAQSTPAEPTPAQSTAPTAPVGTPQRKRPKRQAAVAGRKRTQGFIAELKK